LTEDLHGCRSVANTTRTALGIPRECQGHRALRLGHPITIPHAEKGRTVAMAGATITTPTIAISITTMPVPMITAAAAGAVAGAAAGDGGDNDHHDAHRDDNNAAADDDGGEQHRQGIYERANASSGPMS